MKIKDTMRSLVWMFAAILAMSACSSKDDIPDNGTGEDGPLSVVFSVENESTKAVGDEITPSEAEVKVKRYHVALFQNGIRVDHKEYGEGAENPSLLPAGTNIYKASFSDVVEGNVAVYVIANYPSGLTFPDAEWGTYEQYKAQSVTSDLNEVDGLVKVGYKEFTINSIETGKIELQLSLIQLAAGIDIEVAYADRNLEEQKEPSRYEFLNNTASNEYGIESETNIEKYIKKTYLVETIKNYLDFKPGSAESKWASELSKNDQYKEWNSAGKTWFNRNNDKVYEKLTPTKGALYFRAKLKLEAGSGDEDGDGYNDYLTDIRITAKGRDVMCDVYVPVDGFVTGDISIVNRNKESNILIIKNNEIENTAYTSDVLTSLSSRFYTYELGNHAMELQVNIGRGICLYNVYQKKYRQYGYIMERGQWIKVGKNDHGKYDWEAKKGQLPKEAWLPVTKDSELLEDSKVVARTASATDPGELKDVHTYALTIPGEKIIKGHLYKVKGTHTTIVKPVITWEVVGMDEVEVNPDPFE